MLFSRGALWGLPLNEKVKRSMGFPAELSCRQASEEFHIASSIVPVMVVFWGFQV